MVTQFNVHVFKRLNGTLEVIALHLFVPKEKVHISLLKTSVVTLPDKGHVSRAWTKYNAGSTHEQALSVMRSFMRDIASTCSPAMKRTTA